MGREGAGVHRNVVRLGRAAAEEKPGTEEPRVAREETARV